MNDMIAQYPGKEIHEILDILNTHKPKNDKWLTKHKDDHFHFSILETERKLSSSS